MPGSANYVIVGASLAGASAATTLREEGFDGPVILLGAERFAPYERPPLSKEYLLGKKELASAFVHEPEWYEQHDVDLRVGVEAVGLDRDRHTVRLASGEELGYERLLIATGSSPRRLPIPGAELDGVHYLRTADDSTALKAALTGGGQRLVLIGSGWIGMEVAAAARTLGNEVTVLEKEAVPLSAALGDELGGVFAGLHEEHGVHLRLSVTVTRILGAAGRVTAVELADGTDVRADLVLVAVGAAPNTQLALSAGLAVDDGIRVDASLRTADPAIFAAGDVANAYHPLAELSLRSEHWANALNGGPAAAKAMLGQEVSYDRIPYFFTDQYDLGMEYSGFGPLAPGADLVYRGDRAKREFVVFWVTGGRVVAGMNVNVWDVNDDVQALIRRATPIDPARLADGSIPLNDV